MLLAQATDEELLRGHSAAHIASVDRGWGGGVAPVEGAEAEALPQDIFVSGGTPLAARLSAGCVIEVPHGHQAHAYKCCWTRSLIQSGYHSYHRQ